MKGKDERCDLPHLPKALPLTRHAALLQREAGSPEMVSPLLSPRDPMCLSGYMGEFLSHLRNAPEHLPLHNQRLLSRQAQLECSVIPDAHAARERSPPQ